MPERKTRGVGRPKMAKGRAKARIVPVRFTPTLFKAVSDAARKNKTSISDIVRQVLESTYVTGQNKASLIP
jgi:hypothetical protein